MSHSPSKFACRPREWPRIRGWSWLLLAPALAVGCGGNALSDSEPVGPVHEGMGLYALRVESVRDDCMPAFASGDWGHVIVVVATGFGADGQSAGASIPVLPEPTGGPRFDISFNKPLVVDFPISMPDCSALAHVELSTLAANSAGIDVDWKETITGVASCNSDAVSVASDCTSHRIFHFEWLRACGGHDINSCP